MSRQRAESRISFLLRGFVTCNLRRNCRPQPVSQSLRVTLMEPNVLQAVAHLRILFSLCLKILSSPVIFARDSNPEILPISRPLASILRCRGLWNVTSAVRIDYMPNPRTCHHVILCQYVTENVMYASLQLTRSGYFARSRSQRGCPIPGGGSPG
jgi:hypothetical protein